MFDNKNCVELKECLACGSNDLVLTLDLNMQPLANSYKKNQDEIQEEFPLAINRCRNCYHVQLTHAVNPDLMFKDYLYVSGTSQTMREHFKWFADYATEYFNIIANRKPTDVLDIGCNDGSQLDCFKNNSLETFGIDPAENLYVTSSKNHNVYLGYFDQNAVLKTGRKFDIIVAQNVFAHNYDPLTFLETARQIMSSQSLLFIQTSQADMIKNNEFDTIYHEHISFYNINSMNKLCERAGLNLVDVTKCPLHGNSYIFVISNSMKREANIRNLIDMESKIGLLSDDTYVKYAEKCHSLVQQLRKQTVTYRQHGFKIVGYGAAAKGMTLLNYAKIQPDFIVDDNPLKQGLYTPGMSVTIVSIDKLDELDSNDYVLFMPLAWNFFKEIKNRIKTRRNKKEDLFITYFPKVDIDG